MTKILIFVFILCEILKIVCCGNDSINRFDLQLDKKTGSEKHELTKEKEFIFEDNEVNSEDKSLEKRRLFFSEGDINSEIRPERFVIQDEYPFRRKTNQNKTEDEHKISEVQNFGNDNLETEKTIFSRPEEQENVNRLLSFHLRQPLARPNQGFDWKESDSVSGWNDKKKYKLVIPNSNFEVDGQNNRSPFKGNANDYLVARSGNVFNGRPSITTIKFAEVRKVKNIHGDYEIDEKSSSHPVHSIVEYKTRKSDGYWHPNFYNPDKGVIINLKTECPGTRQFNNQLVHKFIFSPKPPGNSRPEGSNYQLPGTLISSRQMTPMYYL